jgi:hypothetical protein
MPARFLKNKVLLVGEKSDLKTAFEDCFPHFDKLLIEMLRLAREVSKVAKKHNLQVSAST